MGFPPDIAQSETLNSFLTTFFALAFSSVRAIREQEVRRCFDQLADSWLEKETSGDSVQSERNAIVSRLSEPIPHKSYVLDIGCGTGSLVNSWSDLGFLPTGIDLSWEMIQRCKGRKIQNASFYQTSFFDYRPKNKFQILVANGVLEYMEKDSLGTFFELASSFLVREGHLFVSARNRLFNIFSLNQFTEEEIRRGNHTPFFANPYKSLKLFLWNLWRTWLPQGCESSPTAGTKEIPVSDRVQYTPAELISQCRKYRLKLKGVYPLHFHAVPPGRSGPDWETPRAFGYVNQSSSFLLHATRY